MLDEEDDDPVVQEVDVFLSQRLSNALYLFQYPVRPAKNHYENAEHLGARVKPQQNKVELDVALDTRSDNYDRSKGEQIAINVDGGAAGTGAGDATANFYMSERMDKQVLSSVQCTGLPPERFVIGCLHQGELHLTPLKGILQLRPHFGYMDRADSNQTTGGARDKPPEEEEEAKPVTQRFARRNEDKAKKTFKHVSQQLESEAWVYVTHHKMASPDSEHERSRLVAESSNEVSEFQVTTDQYLEKLVTKEAEAAASRPPMPNNVLSMTELRTMTLGDQIKALMTNAKVMRFSQLMSLLSKNTDPNTALTLLQQVALLVQGCWVVKSDTLYPKDSKSAHSGVAAETLCRARDYILWRFTQHRIVIRKEISTVVKIPAEEVKEILEQMARRKIRRGWEFVYEFDSEFVNRHPEVVRMQQMRWGAKFDALCNTLSVSKADRERKAKSDELAATSGGEQPSAGGGEKSKRRRTMSRSRTRSTGTGSGMSDMSDGEIESVPRSRKASGQAARARRNSGRGPELPTKAEVPPPNDVSGSSSIPAAMLNGTQPKQQASPQQQQQPSVIHTSIKQEPLSPRRPPSQFCADLLKTELNKFAREKLQTRFVVSQSEIKTLFDMHLALLPPGHILGTGVSDKMLQQALLDEGAAVVANQGESVFLRQRANDEHDNIRELIVESLQKNLRIRTQLFKTQMTERFGKLPPDAVWRAVLKEYCLVSSNYHQLKGCSTK